VSLHALAVAEHPVAPRAGRLVLAPASDAELRRSEA